MKSIIAVQNKDREGWLGLWHPEGVIQDPVGGYHHWTRQVRGTRAWRR